MKYFLLVILSSISICNTSWAEEEIASIECINISEIQPSFSPPVIFSASIACANEGEPMKAAKLFLFARVYGSYDMKRVSDRSSYQIIGIMIRKTFKAMGDNADSVEHEINTNLIKDPDVFKDFCSIIKKAGKPDYYPSYMINHGMETVLKALGKGQGEGLKSNFDENEAWVKNLKNCG